MSCLPLPHPALPSGIAILRRGGCQFWISEFLNHTDTYGSITRLAEVKPYGLILTDTSILYKSDIKYNIIIFTTKDFLKSFYERPCTLFYHPERQQTWGEEAPPWLWKDQFRGIQPLLVSEVCEGEDLIEHELEGPHWVSRVRVAVPGL